MKPRFIILLFIIILASILRLYQLGKTPVSLEWDEVAIGYDAYSILRTGRDQFGQFLPLTFRSLDDYKPPIYEYLTVPSVMLFDLSSFAVRLPSALSGILAVFLTYLLSISVFSTVNKLKSKAVYLSLLSSFLLALSPWHLQFSRAAFEVNVSVLITLAAVTCFFVGLNRPRYFYISAILFGLDLYSYHSTRVITPLLIASLFIIFNRRLVKSFKTLWFFLIYGVFFLFFIPILFSPDAQIRFKATNIFDPGSPALDDRNLKLQYLDKRRADNQYGFELAGKLFHNNRLIYTDYAVLKQALQNYLSHFGFEFLFIKGDAPIHHAPDFGLLYLWEFPFLLLGVAYLAFSGRNRHVGALFVWFLLIPLPASVTSGTPHAVRTELFLPLFQLFTAVGITVFTGLLKQESRPVWIGAIAIMTILLMLNHSRYLHQYYVHLNPEFGKFWMFGRKEAVAATEYLKSGFDRVIISPRIEMPYIFWLFYTKYPPEKYLSEGGTVSGGFADERNKFDKYEFKYFHYDELPKNEKILLVGTPEGDPNDYPGHAVILKTIYNTDGSVAVQIGQNVQ